MPLSNLKRTELYQRYIAANIANEVEHPELQQLKGVPFYIWNESEEDKLKRYSKRQYNLNELIGLPIKSGKQYPLFDYEEIIFRAPEEREYLCEGLDPSIIERRANHLLCLKSAGLGLTTFFLRYLSWLCSRDDQLRSKDILILSGPREALSVDLITRLRQQFLPAFGTTFDTKETTVFLNGCRIRAFPSNNLLAARGIESCALVFCDEASFFGKDSQSEVLDVIERYAGKNQSKIILLSTPNKPGDLLHTILSQPTEKSFYKILRFNYEWGVNKIYSEEDIRIAKASDSFQREYNLSFFSPQGNIFDTAMIDRAIALGNKYPGVINKAARHSMGIDPGFSSSSFGICVLEYSDDIIKVVYADQFEKTSFNDMVHKVWQLKTMLGTLDNVYCDAANVEFIEAIKQDLGEDSNWYHIHDKIAWARKNNLNISDYMQVVPVSFAMEGASMLSHCKNLIENDDTLVAINSKYDKLIAGLKGAVGVEYKLTKTETPYCDLVDAFRLSMKFFTLRKGEQ